MLALIICVLVMFAGLPVRAEAPAEADVLAFPVRSAPRIDGELTDQAWHDAALHKRSTMAGWNDPRRPDLLPTQQRIAYVCYDARNLYVGMQAFAPDILGLKAGGPQGPFSGDVLEVLIQVVGGEYYHLGIDVDGVIGPGSLPTGADLKQVSGAASVGVNFWAAELAIPWAMLHVEPKAGLRLGFNLAANQALEHEGMWQSLTWGRQFHVRNLETVLELRGDDRAAATTRPTTAPARSAGAEDRPLAVAARAARPPVIDGRIEEAEWKPAMALPAARIDRWRTMDPTRRIVHPRTVWLMHDETNLYVAMQVSGADPELINRDGAASAVSDRLRVDAEGAATGIDSHGKNPGIIFPYQLPVTLAAQLTKDGWQAEMAIPWAQLGYADGKPMLFNLTCQDYEEGQITWAPVRDLRDLERFGRLERAQ